MRIAVCSVSVLLLLAACSCIRKPGRPDSPLCVFLSEASIWECEVASGQTSVETPENLMCTTIEGYSTLERYVDQKEARVRELERQLEQCEKK
jgi:hypothetical protein